MMNDITNLHDIKRVVDTFYIKVQKDDLLAPVFANVVENWNHHLQNMYAFWNTVLFGQPGFKGNPYLKHQPLPIGLPHFQRWLELFTETVDDAFEGMIAEKAKKRADTMAIIFLARIDQGRSTSVNTETVKDKYVS